uniref:Tripartite motif-containing protein 16-like n=1 Tax=Erpetoichthys calabaricus TaxID=27687 RepID=A0A8C4TIF0_ERPCA
MAAAQPSISEDQHRCTVCLDVLKKPVTIPCGHSYCMNCINGYWDQLAIAGRCICPQCRMEFVPRPKLYRNTTLHGLLENIRTAASNITQSQSYAGPHDVPCDVCTERKQKAKKTCMTCMASYCEYHLQPHQDTEALKTHKLEKPTRHLKAKLCPKHQEVLKMYCRTDGTCICLMCAITEHRSHDMVTLDMERVEKQKVEMKKRTEEKERKLETLKNSVMRIQNSADKEINENDKAFTSILQSITRLWSEVMALIIDHKQKKVRKAEEIIKPLEKEIVELKRRDAELAQLSQTDDHVHFIKTFPSLCVPLQDGVSPNATINEDFLPNTLKKDLSDLQRHLEEISSWEFVKTSVTGELGIATTENRKKFIFNSCPLTLDHNTAHRWLQLSERNRKVTNNRTVLQFPDHPDRFEFLPQVLCREALSGTRFYWEVEWSGDWAVVGVAYKGVGRKELNSECRLGFNDKSWSLSCSNSKYSAWHNNTNIEISAPCFHRIGVYLDWPAGSLLFYGISNTMTLLHRFNTSFTEPLYPGFGLGFDSSVTFCSLNPSDQ